MLVQSARGCGRGCGCYARVGGDLPTRCPPPLPAEDVEEEVDGKVRARALALAQQAATKAVMHRRSSDSTRSAHTWLGFGLGLGDLIVRI